jgi:hypothetical protein
MTFISRVSPWQRTIGRRLTISREVETDPNLLQELPTIGENARRLGFKNARLRLVKPRNTWVI